MQQSDLESFGITSIENAVYLVHDPTHQRLANTILSILSNLQTLDDETLKYLNAGMLYNHIVGEVAYILSTKLRK